MIAIVPMLLIGLLMFVEGSGLVVALSEVTTWRGLSGMHPVTYGLGALLTATAFASRLPFGRAVAVTVAATVLCLSCAVLTLRLLELLDNAPHTLLARIGTMQDAHQVSLATAASCLLLSVAFLLQTSAVRHPSAQSIAVLIASVVALAAGLQLANQALGRGPESLFPGLGAPSAGMLTLLAATIVFHPRAIALFARLSVREGRALVAVFLLTAVLQAASTVVLGASVPQSLAWALPVYLLSCAVLGLVTGRKAFTPRGRQPDEGQAHDLSRSDPFSALGLKTLRETPQGVQRLFEFALVFLLAVGALALDATSETIAGIWWANAALTGLLLIRSLAVWPKILLSALAAMLSANLVMGHAVYPSVVMSSVNLISAGIAAAFLQHLLALRVDAHGLHMNRLTSARIALMAVGLGVVIMVAATVSAGFISKSFDVAMHDIWVAWVISDLVGGMAILGIASGLLLKVVDHRRTDLRTERPALAATSVLVSLAALCGVLLSIEGTLFHDLATFGIVSVMLAATFQTSLLKGAITVFLAVIAFAISTGLSSAEGDVFPWTAVLFGQMAFLLRALSQHRMAESVGSRLAMVERGPIMMITYDEELRLVSVSDRVARFLETTPQALIGKRMRADGLLHLADEDAERAEQFHANLAGDTLVVNGILRTPDGEEKPVIIESQRCDDPSLPFRYTAQFTDVSELASYEFANVLLSKTDAIIMVQGEDKRVRAVSAAWVRCTGYSMEESIGADPTKWLIDADAVAELQEQRTRPNYPNREDGKGWRRVARAKDGRRIVFVAHGASQKVGDETLLIMTLVDVTEIEARHEAQLQYLSESPAATVVQGADFTIVSVSDGFKRLTGYTDEDLIGNDVTMMLPEPCRSEIIEKRKRTSPLDTVRTDVRQILCKDGREITMRREAITTRSVATGETLFISSMTDLTAEIEIRKRLSEIALRDPLTGLYTRRYLSVSSDAPQADRCLIAFDIDHFKSVNDAFGHTTGDNLLVEVARVLQQMLPASGVALRIGGEEFGLWLPWMGWGSARAFAEALREAIGEITIAVPGGTIGRTVSIGVARWSADESFDSSFRFCDSALRAAKEAGRDRVVLADQAFRSRIEHSKASLAQVEAALRADEITYHLQPIIDCAANRVIGYEALVRWEMPAGTTGTPAYFLEPYLELTAQKRWLTYPLHALLNACRGLDPEDDGFITVNLPVSAVAFDGAARHVMQLLSPLAQDRKVVLEISEQSMSQRMEVDALRRELLLLRDAGFEIALDDFGREASNLDRLLELPISWLKLDRCLVARSDVDPRARELLRHMPDICETFGARIIAEGVETARQRDTLIGLGINVQQGYLHGRPAPSGHLVQRDEPKKIRLLEALP
jgi:diguanylate cyclase (GGDEF)-like protein/PAS domain S-box-containing protein